MSSNDKMGIGDNVSYVLGSVTEKPSAPVPSAKISPRSNVHAVLRGPDNEIKSDQWGENLVTDYGDDVIATRLFDNAIDIVTGMKLGTGSTAPVKATVATHDMEVYISGSNEALDAAATDATKGAGLGWRTTYVCTWIAGDVTNATINEVCLVNENPLTDVTADVTESVARYVFGATIDKQAGDSLEVTWQIDVLGA